MTKESVLKNQGTTSVKPSHYLKQRHRLALPIILSALFSITAFADENPDIERLADQREARPVTGDLIRIPLGQQSGSATMRTLPRMGAPRAAVLQQLGEPNHRRAAIGEPPISSWEYADVVVYFEHDHVVHTVRKHVPVAGGH